ILMPPDVVDMPSGTPPAWVGFIVDRTGPATLERGLDDMRLRAWSTNDAVFVEAIAPRVDDVRLRRGVAAMYRQVFKMLDAASMPHLWRCWHYLPDIHRDVASGQNRYMHFNAGRHAAYVARYGGEKLGAWLPAASAVGHDGTDLVCHVLAGRTPGVAIEN